MQQEIHLSWKHLHNSEQGQQTFTLPITIGRNWTTDVDLALTAPGVSRLHARIRENNGNLWLVDEGSSRGTFHNDQPVVQQVVLCHGDQLRIGPYEITVTLPSVETQRQPLHKYPDTSSRTGQVETLFPHTRSLQPRPTTQAAIKNFSRYEVEVASNSSDQHKAPHEEETVRFLEKDDPNKPLAHNKKPLPPRKRVEIASVETVLTPEEEPVTPFQQPARHPRTKTKGPLAWLDNERAPMRVLRESGLPLEECNYGLLGGGIGSFVFADHLRIHGVPKENIRVIGLHPTPQKRYETLCSNSQIPPQERIRSNSDSCLDNLWGFPSYGQREILRHLGKFQFKDAGSILWKTFSEPVLSETYTPQAGDVYMSVDKEQQRIGWSEMWQQGRIKAIRKTDDSRYVVLFSHQATPDAAPQDRLLVARFVQLAVGYPGVRFLEDLQRYRQQTGDHHRVVNAYEEHEYIYEHLAKHGGTVLVRGRGIVASRILQRLYEERQKGVSIRVLHLMRKPRSKGNKAGLARRLVQHHWEHQPFNWPKAAWGGDLKQRLEEANAAERKQLLQQWGGTTTADRQDWQQIIQEGLAQGWYQQRFGKVREVNTNKAGELVTHLKSTQGFRETSSLPADFIIDCTGLEASLGASPLLTDLVQHHKLSTNPLGRLSVDKHFKVTGMSQPEGALFAAGAMTLGGPYAAVDSFLGLQYSAMAALQDLQLRRNAEITPLSPLHSIQQWFRWFLNIAP